MFYFYCIEESSTKEWETSHFDSATTENPHFYDYESSEWHFLVRKSFLDNLKSDAGRVLEILQHDAPHFDAKLALSDSGIRVSRILVR